MSDLLVAGARVALRVPRPQDAPRLRRLAGDAEVTRFFSWGPYESERQARDWIETLHGRRERGEALELAIVNEDDDVLGITGVSELSARDRRCVVGTWLGREHWGTGANREAKALVAALAFEELGMERLSAYADVRNLRSQRALEGIGFVREGVLRAFHRHDDEPRDVISYSLLRDEWLESPLRDVPAQISGSAEILCAR